MNAGLKFWEAFHVSVIFFRAVPVASRTMGPWFNDIVRCDASPGFNFRNQVFCVLGIPIFIRIDKDKIKRARKLLDQLMGIGMPCINILAQACFLEMGYGLSVPFFIDFDGDQLSACFAQSPRDPYRRMPCRGSYFQRLRVSVLDDGLIKNLAILLRDVEIPPLTSSFCREIVPLFHPMILPAS